MPRSSRIATRAGNTSTNTSGLAFTQPASSFDVLSRPTSAFTSTTNKPTDTQDKVSSSSMFDTGNISFGSLSNATLSTTTTASTGFTFTPPTSGFSFGGLGASNTPTDNQGQSKDENKNCCGICLTAYKSPRILQCKHIFCRLCLIKLADKKQGAGEELVPLTCPLCREEINLSNCGVDKLPMYFGDDDEDDDEDDDDDDAGVDDAGNDCNAGDKDDEDDDDVKEDQRDLCVVCENSVPAEYECFQCQKDLCGSCKKIHDNLLKHDVQDLKLDLSEDKCLKHPEVKLGYSCLDCGRLLCKECVKSEHSLHQTQTLKSYLMEIDGELKDYSSSIKEKFETIEMSKAMFTSNTESKVLENIENVNIIGDDFKMELQKACRLENKNQHKDQTLLSRINCMGRKIRESKKQRKCNQNLISEIIELQAKISTHEIFYFPNNVDDIINNQIGMMDIQMGRLFEFQLKEKGKDEFNFFFGNLNWTLSTVGLPVKDTPGPSVPQQTMSTTNITGLALPTFDVCISLRAFRKPEDTLQIESITSTVTFSVEGENLTVLKTFTNIFRSEKDQMKWDFKYFGNCASCVKVLFQMTKIKHRAQVK